MNVAILQGRLSSPPRSQTLQSGDELLRLELTVATDDDRPDTVPVSWFGPAQAAAAWPTGYEVVVVGRVRRRWFQTPAGRASRTEVVASGVIPAGRKAAVGKAVARALATVADLQRPPP